MLQAKMGRYLVAKYLLVLYKKSVPMKCYQIKVTVIRVTTCRSAVSDSGFIIEILRINFLMRHYFL